MPLNTEIKARLEDPARVRSAVLALKADFQGEAFQEDTFFHVREGRLKLRTSGGSSELIYYERANISGPKTSHYRLCPVADAASLERVLGAALGVRGIVRKRRALYMLGQTRIHLDEVEGLGAFLELEVVLRPGETPAHGERTAAQIMERLGIAPHALIAGAYIDLLERGEAG